MNKIAILFIFILSSASAWEIKSPEIIVQADGSTNYDGIYCIIDNGKPSDGTTIKLTIEKSASVKWVDLFAIAPNGETIVYCGVEGRDQGSNVLYRVTVAKNLLNASELWIVIDDEGKVILPFKQFKETKG